MIKSKSRKLILGILLCICAAFFALISAISQNAYAYTAFPTGDNAIGNLVSSIDVDGKVKFSTENLKALAKKGGYSTFNKMVKAAEGGAIKTSQVFGDTVINFGLYTFGGTSRELTWIPTYLSKSDSGDAILTLWLANSADANGAVSNQEVSTFSDGTYSDTIGKNWDNKSILSNTYDGSYIRNYVLNGVDNYTKMWGIGTSVDSDNSKPAFGTMTKFSQFTTGVLSNFIVKPGAVSWQKDENRMKNDPAWNNTTNTYGKSENYPSAWTGDNLWLPSMYEVYDSTLAPNSNIHPTTEDGGLWHMGTSNRQKRSNFTSTWLRSASPTGYITTYSLTYDGMLSNYYVSDARGVRPAIHLNLSMVDPCEHTNLTAHPKVTYCDKAGYEAYWECTDCDGLFSDSAAQNEIDEIVTVPATGHSFADSWSSNDLKHWHAATCGHDEKEDLAEHIWDEGEETKAPTCSASGETTYTCTVCAKTKTEAIVKIAHTPEEVAKVDPTCTETGLTVGSRCKVCGETLTAQQNVAATGHDYSDEWETNESNHWHICANECGIKDSNEVHTFTWKVDKAASFTETGLRHEECSVCKFKRNENTVIPMQTCAHSNAEHHDKVPATCSAKGTVEYKYCPDCEKYLDMSNVELSDLDIAVAPDNHVAYGEWETETAATCVATGIEKRVCADCNHEETRELAIDPNAHNLEHHDSQESNCTEVGWNAYDTCTRCDYTTKTEIPAKGHDWATEWSKDETNHWHECNRCDEINDETAHTYDWVITKEATVEEAGLMENICTVCGDKDGEEEIAKLVDPNGEIDLPVDINVEFKVTQSSTGNNYSDIEKGLKRGYWAQLWYRNDDGTLGDEFTDKINCFLTLKIPTEIIEAIRGGEEINRDKIAAGLKVYYIDGEGTPVEVENFTIAMRDDDSWQIKFNYNEKFRAEVVFAAGLEEQPSEPENSGIPWWVWLIVGLVVVAILGVVIVIIVVAKKKNDGNNGGDTEELKAQLAEQGEKIDELLGRDDGGFNTPVELDENGNVIFK